MTETFGPEYVRPPQEACPSCSCCTAELCLRGRVSVHECRGLTPEEYRETVHGCPCSAATTRGTHAWRAAQVRVTRLATERPLPLPAEELLRELAAGRVPVLPDRQVLASLKVRGLAVEVDFGLLATELGRVYLAARAGGRAVTRVVVRSVDVETRTALVMVEGWSDRAPVTVLLGSLRAASCLDAEALPGLDFEAEANLDALEADDVVLTRIAGPTALPGTAAAVLGDGGGHA